MPSKRTLPSPFKPSAASDQCVVRLIRAATQLNQALRSIHFSLPISHVYNPLEYAWPCYEAYLRQFASGPKKVVFLGMNPGPFGMVQTGIPFGEVRTVREWLKLVAPIGKPRQEHPRRLVTGLACQRSEVSGQRLWGLFAQRFASAAEFFQEHLVLNYCPLAFMETSGRNRTPDKLSSKEKEVVFEACDQHLRATVDSLQPEWIIGVGDFASCRAEIVFPDGAPRIGRILHPSPANPAANRAWAALATQQLVTLGVWRS